MKESFYTDYEIEFLTNEINNFDLHELASILGRDIKSVSDKLRHLGIRKERDLKPISKSAKPDIETIEEHIEILYNSKTLHPNYIVNLIKYWRGRIEKLKQEESKKTVKYSY